MSKYPKDANDTAAVAIEEGRDPGAALRERIGKRRPVRVSDDPEPGAPVIEAYRPFPVDALPEPLRSLVVQGAAAIGCDATFIALPLLAGLASAIGNTRRIELKHGWTEPAILWAAIIGDSGTLKSPSLELALRAPSRRQNEAMTTFEREMKAYETDLLRYEIELAAWKKARGQGEPPEKPKEPIAWRCMCDDTTIEKLAVLLRENWRGVLMARDELAAWLRGFDRYSQGKGGDAPKWLEMHGGRCVTVDRKTGDRKVIYIPRAAVSITGGIQPATLRRALGREYFENGLAARLLPAHPPRQTKQWTEAEVGPSVERAVSDLFDRLYSLEPVIGDNGEPEPRIVRLSGEAKALWVKFYNEHAREQVVLAEDLSAAWSKLEGYAARLALVIHMVRCGAGDGTLAHEDVVDARSIAAGVELSRWFGNEARRVYAMLGESAGDSQRRTLVEVVRHHGGHVTARDVMRSSSAYTTSEAVDEALKELVEADIGHWEHVGPGERGGRPTRQFVLGEGADNDTTPELSEESEVSSMSTAGMALQKGK